MVENCSKKCHGLKIFDKFGYYKIVRIVALRCLRLRNFLFWSCFFVRQHRKVLDTPPQPLTPVITLPAANFYSSQHVQHISTHHRMLHSLTTWDVHLWCIFISPHVVECLLWYINLGKSYTKKHGSIQKHCFLMYLVPILLGFSVLSTAILGHGFTATWGRGSTSHADHET